MKSHSAKFLQAVLVLFGIGVLALLLWEPHLEGRNAHATLFQIYFQDPFLAYAYTASIAFFMAVYQAFKLLGYLAQKKIPPAVKALRAIRYCTLALAGFIGAAVAYLLVVRPGDDIAGGVAMGLFLFCVSAATAALAAVVARRLDRL